MLTSTPSCQLVLGGLSSACPQDGQPLANRLTRTLESARKYSVTVRWGRDNIASPINEHRHGLNTITTAGEPLLLARDDASYLLAEAQATSTRANPGCSQALVTLAMVSSPTCSSCRAAPMWARHSPSRPRFVTWPIARLLRRVPTEPPQCCRQHPASTYER